MIRKEMIGKHIEIIDAKNKNLLKLKGKITWETKNTFTLKQNNKLKKVIKSQIIFKINKKKINGEKIQKKPEDRLK